VIHFRTQCSPGRPQGPPTRLRDVTLARSKVEGQIALHLPGQRGSPLCTRDPCWSTSSRGIPAGPKVSLSLANHPSPSNRARSGCSSHGHAIRAGGSRSIRWLVCGSRAGPVKTTIRPTARLRSLEVSQSPQGRPDTARPMPSHYSRKPQCAYDIKVRPPPARQCTRRPLHCSPTGKHHRPCQSSNLLPSGQRTYATSVRFLTTSQDPKTSSPLTPLAVPGHC